jgi:hypothetical protein
MPGQVIALTNEIRSLDGKEHYSPDQINKFFTSIFKYDFKTNKCKVKKRKEEHATYLDFDDEKTFSNNIRQWLDIFHFPFEYEYKIYNFNNLIYEATIIDDDGQEFSVREFGSFVCANGKLECQASSAGDLVIEI